MIHIHKASLQGLPSNSVFCRFTTPDRSLRCCKVVPCRRRQQTARNKSDKASTTSDSVHGFGYCFRDETPRPSCCDSTTSRLSHHDNLAPHERLGCTVCLACWSLSAWHGRCSSCTTCPMLRTPVHWRTGPPSSSAQSASAACSCQPGSQGMSQPSRPCNPIACSQPMPCQFRMS